MVGSSCLKEAKSVNYHIALHPFKQCGKKVVSQVEEGHVLAKQICLRDAVR